MRFGVLTLLLALVGSLAMSGVAMADPTEYDFRGLGDHTGTTLAWPSVGVGSPVDLSALGGPVSISNSYGFGVGGVPPFIAPANMIGVGEVAILTWDIDWPVKLMSASFAEAETGPASFDIYVDGAYATSVTWSGLGHRTGVGDFNSLDLWGNEFRFVTTAGAWRLRTVEANVPSPEPGTLALLGTVLTGAAIRRKRRKAKTA